MNQSKAGTVRVLPGEHSHECGGGLDVEEITCEPLEVVWRQAPKGATQEADNAVVFVLPSAHRKKAIQRIACLLGRPSEGRLNSPRDIVVVAIALPAEREVSIVGERDVHSWRMDVSPGIGRGDVEDPVR